MRKLPPILRPPDGVTAREMERDGRQRQVELRHLDRLEFMHSWGRHSEVIEGCFSCAREVNSFLFALYEPHEEVPRGFRR